jgi:transketolase
MAERAAGDTDQLAINTIRFLSVDMVEKASSGHPGTPMALAPLGYWLWTRHLRHCPDHPEWPDRDRFVLSCGHACALLYSLLHLSGYDMPMAELQRFRQLHSKAAGHPEYHPASGIEVTTGPLGQGIADAVGMACAARKSAAAWNREGFPLFTHRIWVFASDGDLMEGISSEAGSIAGHLRLGNLKVFYDDNRITIEGSTSLAFSEDVAARYAAYGWHVERVADGNDLGQIEAAMQAVEAETERPSIVIVRTVIAYGAPHKQGTADAHGEPLGKEEVALTKQRFGWPLEPTFLVPPEAMPPFEQARERGRRLEAEWRELLGRYREAHAAEAADVEARLAGRLPAGWHEALPEFTPADGAMATRAASGRVLNSIAARLPQLVGGSADLARSNNTLIKGEGDFEAGTPGGRNFHFGVREHVMGAMVNGLALSRLWIPYGATFLIFSDYMRPPLRLAALMQLHVIHVFTHDSIFLGEDGPTHQPISQLAALRAIPRMTVIRPADACETAAAWRTAIEHGGGPVALVLTRQALPTLEETRRGAPQGLPRGAYVLADPPGSDPELLLIATGSEVSLVYEAGRRLAEKGVRVRVVSMPSWELFERQPEDYRRAVLPPGVRKRLAVEAASPFGWHRWVGDEGAVLGMEGFGASAPAKDLAKEFGFTPENVVARAERLLGRAGQ